MVGADEFLADWTESHSLAFAAGVVAAFVVTWQWRPGGVLASLDSPIGIVVVAAALLLAFMSERYRDAVPREPGFFLSGVAMGVVLAARLFS